MLIEQTQTKLRAMKLSQMAKSLEERLTRPDHQDLSVQELMGLIVDDEYIYRENSRLDSRLRGAKFKEKAACMENIAFTGPAGSGKSYLAQSLGHQACRQGYRVLYVRLPKLLTALLQSRADGSYANLLKRFERAHVLILDDLGVSELKENERRDTLEIIEDRYGAGSTLITSQLPIKDWHQYFGGGRAADSLCDRLVHNCHRIELLKDVDSQRKARASLD